ncbi:MAG: YybS family protein [Lachnospiraceae bacterium]|nr:YybS family protein [Lachnospiraceae bacterium]
MNNKNNDTLKITSGAMILAIFAILLLINRQTGALFEELFIYLLPIPMVIYSARFGFKSGLSVLAGTILFSFIFGTFTTIFYSVSASLLGLILGARIYSKRDMTRTLLLVMALSAIFTVLSTVVLASFFGYNVDLEISEMKTMLDSAMNMAGSSEAAGLFSLSFLKQIFIISMAINGLLEGFIVYHLSLLILKRLGVKTEKAVSIRKLTPPAWTGFLALAAYFYGSYTFALPADNPLISGARQMLWVCSIFFLMFFGLLSVIDFIEEHISRKKGIIALLTVLSFFLLSQLLPLVGFARIAFRGTKLPGQDRAL